MKRHLAAGLAAALSGSPAVAEPPHKPKAAKVRHVPASQPSLRGQWGAAITYYAKAAGIDPHVLASLLWHESGMDPSARNKRTGAAGIAQFMPAGRAAVERIRKARGVPWRFTLADAMNPFFAIPAAAELLAYLETRCGSALRAVAAYASGSCNRALSQARRVMRYADWLRRAEEPRS